MKNLIKLQAATIAARARTGDKSIATSIQAGRVRIESVIFNANGASTINSLSSDVTIDQAIEALNAL